MRPPRLFHSLSLVFGLTSLAHADIVTTFDIEGSSVFYGLANDTNTVSGTAVIDITSGVAQNISFTAGGVYETGVALQLGPIVYVGADRAKISFDAGSLIAYAGSAFDLNGPNDLYVGHATTAVASLAPEPSSFILLSIGLLSFAGAVRRRVAVSSHHRSRSVAPPGDFGA